MTGFLDMPPEPAAIVITDDSGGIVSRYIDAAKLYSAQKRHVEIRGSCRSACILALSVPDVCVWPDAIIKAHYAREANTDIIRYDMTQRMLDPLPAKIRVALNGKLGLHYSAAATLDYSQLRRLGISACPGSQSALPATAIAPSRPQSYGGSVLSRSFLSIVRATGRLGGYLPRQER